MPGVSTGVAGAEAATVGPLNTRKVTLTASGHLAYQMSQQNAREMRQRRQSPGRRACSDVGVVRAGAEAGAGYIAAWGHNEDYLPVKQPSRVPVLAAPLFFMETEVNN